MIVVIPDVMAVSGDSLILMRNINHRGRKHQIQYVLRLRKNHFTDNTHMSVIFFLQQSTELTSISL